MSNRPVDGGGFSPRLRHQALLSSTASSEAEGRARFKDSRVFKAICAPKSRVRLETWTVSF